MKTQIKPFVGLRFTHPILGNVIVVAVHGDRTFDVQNIFNKQYELWLQDGGIYLNLACEIITRPENEHQAQPLTLTP